MGILNLTPDSFSDGGQFNTEKKALAHAELMLKQGASIIDIGAQSTRPQAQLLPAREEIKRLGSTISAIKKNFPEVLISLDTFYAEVVTFGYNEGIDIVNDISGGSFDAKLLPTVAATGLPYILMHNHHSYDHMHHKVAHKDIITSLNFYFSEKTHQLRDLGIQDIILDPGFGFGKTIADQIKMVEELQYLCFGEYPLLIGISRKSFIYKPLGKSPLDIKKETQMLHLKMLEKGASILRAHDVADTLRTIRLMN